MEINTIAYPKVNLHLAVGKKRADGFHEIASVFQLVEDSACHDEIQINLKDSKTTTVEVEGLENIADKEDNTIYKACVLFLRAAKRSAKVRIKVNKGIPSQAGLGGGSSDAGAVLRALNNVYPLGLEKIMDIAASVGSDVPFFVSGCSAAVVCGRGEKVFPLDAKELHITLYPNDNEKMSTANAYRLLDDRKQIKPLQSVDYLTKMYNGPVEKWEFYNDFELVNKPASDSRFLLTGSGTCRFTID